ncbi:MAG: hypothetical protein RR306_01825 [Clostridia bacterium]
MNTNAQPFSVANRYADSYAKIKKSGFEFGKLPEGSGFFETSEVLSLPQAKGDSRYVYGKNGFTFWCYSSGYMHANEGCLCYFLRANEWGEPKIAFFATFKRENEENEVIPLLGVPDSTDKAVRYTVFNKDFVTYITQFNGVLFSVRAFVTSENKLAFTITTENKSDEEIDVSISSYFNPFMLHASFEWVENRWFREAKIFEVTKNNLPSFTVCCNENISRTEQLRNFGVVIRNFTGENATLLSHEETTSRLDYVGGSRSSVNMPRSLKKGGFAAKQTDTAFTEVAICGDLLNIKLKPYAKAREDILLDGYSYKEWNDAPSDVFDYKLTADKMDNWLSEIISDVDEMEFDFNFKETKDAPISANSFNLFLNHVKTQVQFCALLKGYTSPGADSLIGVRDVTQALEAYLMWEPKKSREKLLEVFKFEDVSGRFPRQYSLPTHEGVIPNMDIRQFIDQGVWVISTISTYLRYTNDMSILDEDVSYIEILDDKATIKFSDKHDSVLCHLITVMDWLVDKIDSRTNCVRVLFGDWNDALDGLGVSKDGKSEFGTGVSVMATTQVWQNLAEMAQILKLIDENKYAEKINEYLKTADLIEQGLHKFAIVSNEKGEKRIAHGWGDKGSYYVASFNDPDNKARLSLTSHAFWVLSGLYRNSHDLAKMLDDNILALDAKYGIKTFDPGFSSDAPGVGRIPKLPIGTAENGATYVHASVFGIMALFELGDYENAWKQLVKVLPFTHEMTSVAPFVMPNSYGYNIEKNIDGQSMSDWQTGSSNVLIKLLTRCVIGINPCFDGVWLRPATYCPFDSYSFKGNVKNTPFTFNFNKTNDEKTTLSVNGKEILPTYSDVLKEEAYFIEESYFKNNIIVEFNTNK